MNMRRTDWLLFRGPCKVQDFLDDLRCQAQAWRYDGAGPAMAWILVVWTLLACAFRAGCCKVLGHRMRSTVEQINPVSIGWMDDYCDRCGWSEADTKWTTRE